MSWHFKWPLPCIKWKWVLVPSFVCFFACTCPNYNNFSVVYQCFFFNFSTFFALPKIPFFFLFGEYMNFEGVFVFKTLSCDSTYTGFQIKTFFQPSKCLHYRHTSLCVAFVNTKYSFHLKGDNGWFILEPNMSDHDPTTWFQLLQIVYSTLEVFTWYFIIYKSKS